MSIEEAYGSPGQFKAAFDRRYREQPRALIIMMERFAARVCQEIDSAVIKGGLGLELRLETPRTTKDADLVVSGSANLEVRLKQAGKMDLGDYLRFAVKPNNSSARSRAFPRSHACRSACWICMYRSRRKFMPTRTRAIGKPEMRRSCAPAIFWTCAAAQPPSG